MSLRFDGKVVVVTGAGGGLGRAYALAFAKRGARVVVNDLGGSKAGSGASTKAAEDVVAEIKAAGGDAVANYDSVEDGPKIIETAIKAFNRVDILINNAGILRDASLNNMTDGDWDLISAVHLRGAFKCTKAAWPHMQKQQFGRILNVTSTAGIYGNFGQVNYSTAKSGILGFTKAVTLEGARKNIFANAIAPLAASRMTESIMPKEMLASLTTDAVVPLALWLCHEDSGCQGEIIEAGAGWFAKIRVERSRGAYLPRGFGMEDVQKAWERITDFTDATHPTSAGESIAEAMKAAKKSKL